MKRSHQLWFVLNLLCCACLAQQRQPADLVRAAANNEVKAVQHPEHFWMYRLTKESKSGLQVKDMVETKDGIIARLVSLNGHGISPAERAADDARLDNLQQDPQEQRRRSADQQKEQDRFLSLIRALPDALLYSDDGTEDVAGRPAIRLKFKPNPAFHPSTKESIIFRASEGHIWIDAADDRIVKFDGVTTSDINIGWGLLGHVEKGSRLHLEQVRVTETEWRLSKLLLEGEGSILFFKSFSLQQKQTASGFQPVPKTLSLSDAIGLLKKQPYTVAREAAP